ncbi:MAG: glycosyltransferase family 10 domain-containing protein [Azonexus sp.]
MAVVELDIVDTSFAHAPGMSWYNVPKHVKWVRTRPSWVPIRFFTDRSLGQVDNYPADVNVALLIEPMCFDNTGYDICLRKLSQFKHVLTYDENFKQQVGDKGLLYAIGGCWLRPEEIRFHNKTLMTSIIASEKRSTHGHQLRHVAVNRFGQHLGVFGRGYRPVQFKSEALAPYRFSVTIENGQIDTLFTEKLIDCFLTGTVPIYWGTPKIAEHFNMDGVIAFNTMDELGAILENLNEFDYARRTTAIVDNFTRANRYRVAEDYIFEKFPFLLP